MSEHAQSDFARADKAPWLDQVPPNWSVIQLKRLIQIRNGSDYKQVADPAGDIPVIGSGGVFAKADRALYTGEAVLLGRKGTIDKPLYIDGPFWPVDTMFYSVARAGVSAKFVYYAALNIPFDLYSSSTALPSMTQETLSSHITAAPDSCTQKEIASALDHETSRIDALIEKKTRFIELLKEKRQALTTQAVTKGLDPNVPMRDSGVEWIGEVPEHWDAGKIGYEARLESGHTPSRKTPEYWENCTIRWFTLADIWQVRRLRRQYIDDTSEYVSELGLANSSARILPMGTVVLSRTASVGFPAILNDEMAVSQDFAAWICGNSLNNCYLYWALIAMKIELSRLTMGSTHKTIYMPDIAELRCPLPPYEEQIRITQFVESQSTRIDDLISKIISSVDLLKERRSALITAAVTGQIDILGGIA